LLSDWTDRLPGISGVRTEFLALEEPFDVMAARFAGQPGTVVLLSGGDLNCARYHILALRPWMTLTGRHGKTTIAIDGTIYEDAHSPLDVLRTVLHRCRLNDDKNCDPVAAGLFGYLAYDLKDELEVLPRTSVDDLDLPSLFMAAPSLIVLHDKTTATTRIHIPLREDWAPSEADARIEVFHRELKKPVPPTGGFRGNGKRLQSNFSQDEYEAAVQRIREYIAAGDVYQVNLSQRFEAQFSGNGYGLFQALYEKNPASFFAYVNAGDHRIVSTSPERFLLRQKDRVETRPIKGTRPRGQTPEQDAAMKAELAKSPKDDAELSMIVDLLRNDIGKACAGGSVVVAEHKRLEAYQNVYHLVSVVEGTLAEGKDSVDLIKAAFPGGSITGCPKIRSMEIIDELESRRRHIYTGSIGYISFHDTMDLSIAIRTATIVDDRIVFSVGGGIVFDSDPADEFEETLHKGRTLMSVFQGAAGPTTSVDSEPQVWLNGRILPQSRAAVPATDLGLQYGYGIFETVRVERGRACRLQNHVNRFNRSWEALFGTTPPDVTWEDVIAQVIGTNGLADAVAAVKILATRGEEASPGCNNTLLVSARPYLHRLEALGSDGLRLATFPHPRMTPLADHKSLNYLYYHQAGAWVLNQGADEAVILNPDGTVSETNTANLLVVSGRTATRPASPHVLPGVMQTEICRRLAARGYSILDEPARPEDLHHADALLVTNALMGVVPALRLDNQPLKTDPALIQALQAGLFRVDVHF
jgi:para-aminobenzoate synthetase component 1